MSTTLYASPYGGSCYHRTPVCTGLSSYCMSMCTTSAPTVSRTEVERRNLRACSICSPRPILLSVPLLHDPDAATARAESEASDERLLP